MSAKIPDSDVGPPKPTAQRIADALKRDLPRQYDRPQTMDFSIYDRRILFTDPMTRLKGWLNYAGMIWTIAVLARVVFRPSTVSFELSECCVDGMSTGDDNVKADTGCEIVRTRFATKGETRWASSTTPPLVISGTDRFHVSLKTGKITRHESLWDQTPDEVKDAFFTR
jgi:Uncharacterized conserved protein (DUF2358)